MMLDATLVKLPDVKYVGRLPGRYALPERKSLSGVSVFACQTQSVSPQQVVVVAPVLADIGAIVAANIDSVGIVKGNVGRLIEHGFAIDIDAELNDVHKLANRISWLKRRRSLQVSDSRSHKRYQPRHPHTKLLLADGSQIDCFLVDISRSGAAVSADLMPEIGEPMAVGSIVGKVVRHFEAGFAVEFVEPPHISKLEHMLLAHDFGEMKSMLKVFLNP